MGDKEAEPLSDEKVELSVTIPLDADGFLRRECPTCERELKWMPTPEGVEPVPVPDGGYFCPYCGVQAGPEAWHTRAQVEYFQRIAKARVVDPMLVKFGNDIRQMGRRSRGVFSVSIEHERSDEPEPLSDDDDMRRVDFECHPSEPIKVLQDWNGAVRCIICDQAEA
jgi:hypothetical protein